MVAVNLDDAEELRRRREQSFADIHADADRRLESDVLNARLKRLLEEYDQVFAQIKEVKGEQRKLLRDVARAERAQAFVRQNPPPAIKARLTQIELAKRQLREEYEPQRLRQDWLRDQLKRTSRTQNPQRHAELTDTLAMVDGELSQFAERTAALDAERSVLIRRCVQEVWPELEEKAPEAPAPASPRPKKAKAAT